MGHFSKHVPCLSGRAQTLDFQAGRAVQATRRVWLRQHQGTTLLHVRLTITSTESDTTSAPRQIARSDENLAGLPVLTTDQRTADRESDDRKRYRVGPETCELASTALMNKILGTIDDEDTRDDLELECGGHGVLTTEPVELGMDNQSAIAVAYNPEHHTTLKHVDRRHFYVRELVENHMIRCPFVSTVDNLADFFTKAQPPSVFFSMRDQIMNVPGPRPRGGVERSARDVSPDSVTSQRV